MSNSRNEHTYYNGYNRIPHGGFLPGLSLTFDEHEKPKLMSRTVAL